MSKLIGLSEEQAKELLIKEGKNILHETKKVNIFKIFFESLKDPLMYLLLFSSIVSFAIKEIIDGCIILFVILLNSIISTFQEYKASKSIESLKTMTTFYSHVIRDGVEKKISSFDIVTNDIVILEEGDVVPSDLILLESNELSIDESSLTGESMPVEKRKDDKVFATSKVMSGKGIGYVFQKGLNTEIGKISKGLNEKKNDLTPLQLRLKALSKQISIITISLTLLMFIVFVIQGNNILDMLVLCLSTLVAAVPEGLVSVVTIVLTIGVSKLSKRNVITRDLASVETLGSVDVICVDKTGTITKNELSLKEINLYHNKEELLLCQFLYNNTLRNGDGDPLEKASYKYVLKKKIDIRFQKENEIPFSSIRKMMSVIGVYNNERIILTKGALEEVIKKSKYIMINNKKEPLTERMVDKLKEDERKMANKALRILAYAYSQDIEEKDLTIIALVGFIDPPRRGVKEAVNKLHKAGIDVICITGDNLLTAYQISKEVGIVKEQEECLLGEEISNKKDLDKYKVFARVSPFHKAEIVDYYKKKGKVVAMTGDGVNDSLSLKKADVSIAMGKRGSEVSKEVASLVLKDDNFSTIEKAVEEGRNIYINIKKAILFLLSSNLGEILVMSLFILLGFPTPLLPIHILFVNLISDSLPSLALGSDEKYDDVMEDKPLGKKESIFSRGGLNLTITYGIVVFIITSIAYLILPFIDVVNRGLPIGIESIKLSLSYESILIKSRTLAFSTLGLSQLFHMIGMSNTSYSIIEILKHKNIFLIITFLSGILIQFLLIEIPLFNSFFSITSLSIIEWLWLLVLSSVPLMIHEVRRKIH